MQSSVGGGAIRVVYISGWGRSGTTIVDRVLGQLPGFCSVGELRSLWDCDPATHACSCGRTIGECGLWAPTLQAVLGGVTDSEFTFMRALRNRVGRSRDLPWHWASSATRRPPDPVTTDYGDRLEALYRAVAERSGTRTIVDSSKHPSEALALARRPGIELHLLHMVRDPRGVAYSWSRSRERHEAVADGPPERGALSSTAWWTTWNAVIELALAPKLDHRYIRVRYEDVMSSPRSQLSDIAMWAGGQPETLDFIGNDEVTLRSGHLVAGNPNRSLTGRIRLRRDTEWQSELPRADRWMSTMAALPMLPHYRYPIFS